MEFEFGNKNLETLYTKGKHSKYRLQQGTLKKFSMRIQQIEAANTIHDFWKTPSLNFEKLEGHQNRYSIRVDKTYRLELEIDWSNEEKTVGKVFILELSKHYGD